MISKASELLELFIKEESRNLEKIKMPHMPTLGSAYEEVTKQGIDKNFAIPKNLDLRVVAGFISIGDEMMPEQIDCMLVHGDGMRYGLTQQYVYDIERVLCIFEVKKTLNKADYRDAMVHLGKIRAKFAAHFEQKLKDGYEPEVALARQHFSQITGKVAPQRYSGLHQMSKGDAILFYCLVQETLAPISIIHGYAGYRTERGLRSAFLDILEEKKVDGIGFGIPSIPSLVTSNQFCLVKANGFPFLAVKDQDEWIAVISTRHNSAKLILEAIWSKIACYFDVAMPWNDGLHMDNVAPLLIAKAVEIGDASGWMYEAIDRKELRLQRTDDNVWSPAKVGAAEASVIGLMAMKGGQLPLDSNLSNYLRRAHDVDIEKVRANLLGTRAFMLDGEFLRPIKHCTHLITLDDGTGFVGTELDRFDLWCKENAIDPNYLNLILVD